MSRTEIGHKIWAIPEGYIPSYSNGPAPSMTSHETVCLLNTNDEEATVKITIYFSDQDPMGPYHVRVAGRRTKHLRLNDLKDPQPIPLDTEYALIVESDRPIVVQYTRLDTRQAENALMTTMAFAVK